MKCLITTIIKKNMYSCEINKDLYSEGSMCQDYVILQLKNILPLLLCDPCVCKDQTQGRGLPLIIRTHLGEGGW